MMVETKQPSDDKSYLGALSKPQTGINIMTSSQGNKTKQFVARVEYQEFEGDQWDDPISSSICSWTATAPDGEELLLNLEISLLDTSNNSEINFALNDWDSLIIISSHKGFRYYEDSPTEVMPVRIKRASALEKIELYCQEEESRD